ncbi:hypothetical protein HA402_000637 [Bradysia odoriphaga]|nr:hypothetical protein HA402_000637 [Bradysia odoriphaga]
MTKIYFSAKKRQTHIAQSVIPKSNEIINNEEQSTPSIDGKVIANWGRFGIVLQNFVNSSERNADRKKAGYRFDPMTKAFAAYTFMLAGPLAYETFNANLPYTLPSTSTVHRYLADNGPQIIEGKMRSEELLLYLKKRNLPLVVSLSEDATRITARISYDPNTNQLIGFALPLDNNGMPITLSFPARSISEIRNHFSNPSNNMSSSLYVQMARPLDPNVPAFCLMMFLTDNTFKADKVYKRWKFQADQLKENGVKIHNIASDGDSRPLKAMKYLSRIGQPNDSYFDCEWFSCGAFVETTFTQDLFHILTKLRNLLLKCSRIIPVGNKIVSATHLNYLIENVSKDKHKLTRYDIEPKDRQNVTSAEKICTENVMECLSKYVPGSEGTIMFLRAMRYVSVAFSESNVKSSDRIYYMWYSVFFFRAWRSWIIQSEKVKNGSGKSNSKKFKHVYTLKENFISGNCYSCIELNAHALIKQILVEDSEQGTQKIFFPDLYASQPCEKIFRQVRSFTSTFSTVVNFNMLDVIHRIKKVQLQSDIIAEWNDRIKFPRFEKKLSVNDGLSYKIEGLNRTSIITEIEKAKNAVTSDLQNFEIDTSVLNFHCQVKPVLDMDDEGDSDSDIDSDVEELGSNYDFFEDEGEFSLEENEFESLDFAEHLTAETYLPDKYKLSSDRLVRVQEKDYLKGNIFGTGNTCISNDSFVVCDQITIGEWCIFYDNIDEENKRSKILVGHALGFTYLDGDTFKKREFSKRSASIPS